MVDGGGVEEKQNNCAIVTTEKKETSVTSTSNYVLDSIQKKGPIKKKETSVTSTSNYVLDSIQKKGPIIARYTTHDHLVRGRLYLFTFSGELYQKHYPLSRTKRIRNFVNGK